MRFSRSLLWIAALAICGSRLWAASSATDPANPRFSGGVNEVVKLHQAGLDRSVIEAYIEGSPLAFAPSADELVALHEAGIPADLVTAMIRRGAKVREETAAKDAARIQAAAPAAPQRAVPPAAPSQPIVARGYLIDPGPTSGPVLNYPVPARYTSYAYAYAYGYPASAYYNYYSSPYHAYSGYTPFYSRHYPRYSFPSHRYYRTGPISTAGYGPYAAVPGAWKYCR